jgi:hypothetical protein
VKPAYSDELLNKHKLPYLEEEFCDLDPLLITVFIGLCGLSKVLFNKQLIVTSMFRPTGNHASYRMLDFDVDERRVYNGLFPEEAQIISNVVAASFVYDISRPHYPVAVYGPNDAAGVHWDHVHLQVCANRKTKFRRLDLEARWKANIVLFASIT